MRQKTGLFIVVLLVGMIALSTIVQAQSSDILPIRTKLVLYKNLLNFFEIDKDRSGTITKDEFVKNAPYNGRMEDVFDLMDADRDMMVTSLELDSYKSIQ